MSIVFASLKKFSKRWFPLVEKGTNRPSPQRLHFKRMILLKYWIQDQNRICAQKIWFDKGSFWALFWRWHHNLHKAALDESKNEMFTTHTRNCMHVSTGKCNILFRIMCVFLHATAFFFSFRYFKLILCLSLIEMET